ncbi:helix-turn-helix transcriptional regulator [Pseudoflavitalea rhizosphaerae]|uniref:helix-turn-helix transcriptional regulator n=1 Tax=Pseudoflavitalea rhizosphaerae TaxID=1884793 RepID=UPI000F8E88C8|nr:helix-turn-helix transcriptional regulator [Pseudoflavitalea rhizosphaerae]
MEQSFAKRPVHMGQNIQKFRLIREKSQGDVAAELEVKRGKAVSQQFVSDLENKETIEDDELLKQIAEILKVDAEVLKKMDWDAAISIIGNTFTNNDYSQQQFATFIQNSPVYHPLDKLLEFFEKERSDWKSETEALKAELAKLRGEKK